MSPIRLWIIALLAATLIGCSSEPTSLLVSTPTRVFIPTSPPPSPIPNVAPTNLPVSSPSATATRVIVPAVTATTAPTVKVVPTATSPSAAGKMTIKLFFVALEDNGKSGIKIGCNDSIVAVDRQIPATQAPLTASLNELFSIHDKNYGQSGLYNALANANLKVDGAAVINGKATIYISGTLNLSGVCDDPRVQAQIEQVALQFSTVKQVSVFLNGIPIEKALSQK
ncbi:MAG: GerMN domain-containing protein [Chloroflexi bacterium]|nr:GerMN domain-containing protein [Chloroflexota bacterium]